MCRKASFHTLPVPSSTLTPLSVAQCAVWTVSPLSTGHYTFCNKDAYDICVHYDFHFPHYGENETQMQTGHFTSFGFLSPHYRFLTFILYNKVWSVRSCFKSLLTLKTLKSSPDTKNLPFPDLGCRYHHLKNLKPDKWGKQILARNLSWKGLARIAIDQAQEFYITEVNFNWKYWSNAQVMNLVKSYHQIAV